MSCDFETTTCAKWILVGEHAVIRGHPALVFPVYDKTLHLRYQPINAACSVHYEGLFGKEMQGVFERVLAHGFSLLGETSQNLTGAFHLESNIPIGVGLGASAALCVAVARFFAVNHVSLDVSLFARELEHLFHGRSSGLDIAGVAASSGIYFQTGMSLPIQQGWEPTFRLSSSEQIGITADCIQQVEAIWQRDPARARAIDTRMAESVLLARQALESDYTKQSEATLARAINQAADCFYQWGLVTDGLKAHMQALTEKGALAVKPTGSGGGGYVVSLWPG